MKGRKVQPFTGNHQPEEVFRRNNRVEAVKDSVLASPRGGIDTATSPSVLVHESSKADVPAVRSAPQWRRRYQREKKKKVFYPEKQSGVPVSKNIPKKESYMNRGEALRNPIEVSMLKKKYGTLTFLLYNKKLKSWPGRLGNPSEFFEDFFSETSEILRGMDRNPRVSDAESHVNRLYNQLEYPTNFPAFAEYKDNPWSELDRTLNNLNIPWQQLHELAIKLFEIHGLDVKSRKSKS